MTPAWPRAAVIAQSVMTPPNTQGDDRIGDDAAHPVPVAEAVLRRVTLRPPDGADLGKVRDVLRRLAERTHDQRPHLPNRVVRARERPNPSLTSMILCVEGTQSAGW